MQSPSLSAAVKNIDQQLHDTARVEQDKVIIDVLLIPFVHEDHPVSLPVSSLLRPLTIAIPASQCAQ